MTFCFAVAVKQESGIGNAGHSGIADKGNLIPALKHPDVFLELAVLVVLVVGHAGGGDLVMVQQMPCGAGVLRKDAVRLLQCPQRPQGDVLQVADGSRNDKEFHCTVLIKMQKYTILRE